jgi:general secretion pathway protein B
VSFILDALRKSESERQRLGGASIAELPVGERRSHPWWIFALAALLFANLGLLAVIVLRPASKDTVAPAVQTPASQPATARVPPPAAQVRIAAPPAESLADAVTPPAEIDYELVDREAMEAASSVPAGPTLVKPIESNTAEPTSLDNLRVDMHVYSPQASQRFVMINMRKYAEGQTLAEGPHVEQITPTGVTLNYQGTRWQLSRP